MKGHISQTLRLKVLEPGEEYEMSDKQWFWCKMGNVVNSLFLCVLLNAAVLYLIYGVMS